MQSGPSKQDDGEEEAIFAEINITPLTDVFLVLLIIFMLVSSTLVEADRAAAAAKNIVSEKAMEVQTPKGQGENPLVPEDVVITIAKDGTIFLEEDQMTVSALGPRLAQIKSSSNAVRVVIRGDKTAEYQLIMEVISQARAAGITDVALASRAQ